MQKDKRDLRIDANNGVDDDVSREPVLDAVGGRPSRMSDECQKKYRRPASVDRVGALGAGSEARAPSPRSPLSGCRFRDVIRGTESLYPIQIQWNMAELYGGLAP